VRTSGVFDVDHGVTIVSEGVLRQHSSAASSFVGTFVGISNRRFLEI
jgi:hypothetical protein